MLLRALFQFAVFSVLTGAIAPAAGLASCGDWLEHRSPKSIRLRVADGFRSEFHFTATSDKPQCQKSSLPEALAIPAIPVDRHSGDPVLSKPSSATVDLSGGRERLPTLQFCLLSEYKLRIFRPPKHQLAAN